MSGWDERNGYLYNKQSGIVLILKVLVSIAVILMVGFIVLMAIGYFTLCVVAIVTGGYVKTETGTTLTVNEGGFIATLVATAVIFIAVVVLAWFIGIFHLMYDWVRGRENVAVFE